ncbi:hypothetical protein C8F01DRAFT_1115071 [Mycena amicta]|nr:hypothetical protein C8F01DRAFT_1115071 [Mycena amicta]
MSTDERPAKRPRQESDLADTPPLTRSVDCWLDDGNIILQVESTQFRVTQSILAMHSTVFRDMFSLPLPADEPLVDNSPVVVLPGDKSEDWKHLLDAMYPKQCFDPDDPTLEQIAGVLRLSKKYDIRPFREECIRRLKGEFPATLGEYEVVCHEWTNFDVPDEASRSSTDVKVQVANLAREVGLYSVLPTAFFDIARCADDTIPGVLNEHVSKLSIVDQLACLTGYVELTQSYTKTPLKWLEPGQYIPCEDCTQESVCASSQKDLVVAWAARPTVVIGVLNKWEEEWDSEICVACRIVARKVHEEARKACWEKLPSYFGLPDWQELLRMDLE